jgi:uncharacterized membrane protein YkoI
MRVLRWMLPVAVMGILVAAADVRGGEEDIPLNKVPKAVMDSVKAKFPGAEMKGAAKEEEEGKTSYEVSITYGGKKIDVVAKPDGTILAVETVIKAADLPAAVKKTLEAKYPKAEYKTIESIEEGDKLSYEVLLETADDKDLEITLDRNGKILETEEKKESEKDEKDEKKKD